MISLYRIDCDKLAQRIWNIARTGTGAGTFDIWEDYGPSLEDEPSGCYRVEVFKFADTTVALIVYYGGGYAWVYEFGGDADPSCLTECLGQVFKDLDRQHFWVEE